MIKLLLMDVDGVLNSGWKTYDIEGNVISKQFYDKDFDYINKIRDEFEIPVVWISGDRRCNEAIATKRGIPFIYSRQKENELQSICEKYKVLPDEIMFAGDSIHDIALLEKIGYRVTVKDAAREIFRKFPYLAEKHSFWTFEQPIMNQVYEQIERVNSD